MGFARSAGKYIVVSRLYHPQARLFFNSTKGLIKSPRTVDRVPSERSLLWILIVSRSKLKEVEISFGL